ncbi:MAG TPA: acyl-CoA desaturase [Thermoanaerobaculia bacterium]|nr:acyl-CoA desaturase [Thermoanaerobaculia bacterium]
MQLLLQWLDTDRRAAAISAAVRDPDRIDWLRCTPFLLLHAGCLAVFLVGWSWTSVAIAAALYLVRMFGITGIYHRYFSHRTFRTSRAAQFVFALIAASSAQRGPLWWAANHREHHRASDTEGDPHSPLRVGFFRAHAGWFMSSRFYATNYRRIQDFARFPELVWLNRFDSVVPLALAAATYAAGTLLERFAPSLGVTGPQLFVWAFVLGTTVLFHATASINSLAHLFGSRRYATGDESRNNVWLALITLGEGWHNNHHQHMGCTRQGFYWWEIDVTYYALRVLSWMGIVWDLRRVPDAAYDRALQLPAAVSAPAGASRRRT